MSFGQHSLKIVTIHRSSILKAGPNQDMSALGKLSIWYIFKWILFKYLLNRCLGEELSMTGPGGVKTGLVKSLSLHVPFKITKALQVTRPDLPGRQIRDHLRILKYAFPYSRLFIKASITAALITTSSKHLKGYCFVFFSVLCCIPNDVFLLLIGILSF